MRHADAALTEAYHDWWLLVRRERDGEVFPHEEIKATLRAVRVAESLSRDPESVYWAARKAWRAEHGVDP
jgi:hypothetical protein